MKLINQQKLIIGVSALAVVVLVTTTIWSNPQFGYQQPSQEQQQAYRDSQEKTLAAYRQYLAELKVDPVASKEILNEVVDEKALALEVRTQIGADRPALQPKVDTSKFAITDDTSIEAISKYATAALDSMNEYYINASGSFNVVYVDDPDPVLTAQALKQADQALDTLYALEVPKNAVGLQSSIIGSVALQKKTVENVDAVARGVAARGNQWSDTYPAFAAAQTQVAQVDREIQGLTKTYGVIPRYDELMAVKETNPFIKTAQAQWLVSIGVDIPRLVEQYLRSALGAIALNFANTVISKLVQKLENNYLIANFLYYGDAVAGKYVNSWLTKYVPDAKDQQMIQAFIPQFNCKKTNQSDIKTALRAKSLEYLGFDPTVPIDPADPTFYQKIISANSLRGDSEGYQLFYNALAKAAGSNADTAKEAELVSPGKKSPLDEQLSKGIAKSVDFISKKIEAGLNSLFNILPTNATTGGPGFSAFLTNILISVVNQLIVKGAVTLKEQPACIQVPVVNPIIPGDFTPAATPVTNSSTAACVNSPEACETMLFEKQQQQQQQYNQQTSPTPTLLPTQVPS
ncbi:MAG: hypothetical protein KBD66_01325 [Candidatus Doudnabacteria bacterium]|nr:hypothetical protein [Candidatus Doudnabacteria bacterium]